MIDLRQLRYFITVVEERSITRAANQLGIQQPPLSIQIKKLEDRVGVKLLNRIPSGVEPTPAGRAFYDDCVDILSAMKMAIDNAQRIDRSLAGRIIVGVTRSTMSHPRVRTAIKLFMEENQEIAFNLVTDGSFELCDSLSDNRLDVAFVRPGNDHPPTLRVEEIASEDLVVATPVGLFDPALTSLSLKDLVDHKLILYRDSSSPILYHEILGAFSRENLLPTKVQNAPSANLAINMVSAQIGVSIVPSSMSDHQTNDVQYYPIRHDGELSSSIAMMTRLSETNQTVRQFRRTVTHLD